MTSAIDRGPLLKQPSPQLGRLIGKDGRSMPNIVWPPSGRGSFVVNGESGMFVICAFSPQPVDQAFGDGGWDDNVITPMECPHGHAVQRRRRGRAGGGDGDDGGKALGGGGGERAGATHGVTGHIAARGVQNRETRRGSMQQEVHE
eukprot:6175049-Pleurochrysis_carterae.AAC.5